MWCGIIGLRRHRQPEKPFAIRFQAASTQSRQPENTKPCKQLPILFTGFDYVFGPSAFFRVNRFQAVALRFQVNVGKASSFNQAVHFHAAARLVQRPKHSRTRARATKRHNRRFGIGNGGLEMIQRFIGDAVHYYGHINHVFNAVGVEPCFHLLKAGLVGGFAIGAVANHGFDAVRRGAFGKTFVFKLVDTYK